MDLSEIKRLIKLVEESGIQELEVEEEGTRIRVNKGSGPSLEPDSAEHPASGASATSPHTQAGPEQSREERPPPLANGTAIESPMVGTFHSSPSPDSLPFVKVGSDVSEETVVCILEAMKVMNEIKAGCSGRVAEVLVEDGDPVEFGQPLFRVVSE